MLCEWAHLPVKDNAPDEAQRQLVVPIHDICASYVYQIHLADRKEMSQTETLSSLKTLGFNIFVMLIEAQVSSVVTVNFHILR